MVDAALFKSDKHDWGTPKPFWVRLDAEFRFELDACAHAGNFKHPNYLTVEDDALSCDWGGKVVWLNPPYGDQLKRWMEKAAAEARKGATVVCLVPARTDTAWWHRHVHGIAHEVRLVSGRLRFEGAPSTAPFPSAVIIYRPGPAPESTHYTRMAAKAERAKAA
jgi:site-specific DNA-methyltransferase (adenine-specific)